MTNVRVLLLESIHADAVARLEAEGYHVESVRNALDEAELIERIPGVSLLGIRSKTKVTADVLAAADSLVAIGAFCIGTDQIDLVNAAARGVAVFNAPFSNTRSVVELAVSEIIALTRRLPEKNIGMHNGLWDKAAEGSHEIRGRRLGIVGYGNIGTQLSVLAENLGMHVSFYDTADKLALSNAHRCAGIEELLETSDVVTLHVDGRPGNAGFFGADQFKRMRPGAIFLNLSRGIVVDHVALRAALESPRAAATSSSPSCAACPTSSSPRTSAGPPRRRSPTSATSWPTNWSTSCRRATPRSASTCPASRCRSRRAYQHAGGPGPGQQHPGRAQGERRGSAAEHPRRIRLSDHRHQERLLRRRARSVARHGADGPPARSLLKINFRGYAR